MKHLKFLFIIVVFLLSLFISACTNNSGNNNEYEMTITADNEIIMVGESTYVFAYSNKVGNIVYESSDKTIAKVDNYGKVDGIKIGKVTIKAYLEIDPSINASIDIEISEPHVNEIKLKGALFGKVGDLIEYSYILYPRSVGDVGVTFSSSDEGVISITPNGVATLISQGICNITITTIEDVPFSKSFQIGVYDFSEIIVDTEYTYTQEGNAIEYLDKTYFEGYTYVNSLKKALNMVSVDGTVYLIRGDVNEEVIINENGIRLYGINYDNDDPSTWNSSSVISKAIVVGHDISDIEIKGLTLTGSAYINLWGNNFNVLIKNNQFINNTSSNTWRTYTSSGCIYFDYYNQTNSDNICITNNVFNNIKNYGIVLNYVNNLKITNNTFNNFELDAIHFNDGEISEASQWLFKDNIFEDGKCNAIYANAYGPKFASYENIVSIFDNVFENIGENSDNFFYGAISFDNYNGGTVTINMRYNEFKNCLGNIHIDNATKTSLQKNLETFIEYNKFFASNSNYIFTNATNHSSYKSFDNAYIRNNYFDNSSNELITGAKASYNNNLNLAYFNMMNKLYGTQTLFMESGNQFVSEIDNVTWKSSNNEVLTVSDKGFATPVSTGDACITISKNGTDFASIEVVVKESLNIDYASLLVRIALNEEGYVEGPNNYTKYGVWYGETHGAEFAYGAWCAMFVSWCANQANIPTTVIPEYALCSAGRDWFEKRGLFQYKEDYTPKTGDIIFFLSNGAGHTGIVVDYRDGKVYTIEGNTSNMCHQRSYYPNHNTITGYGTPLYPVYTGTKIVFDISNATDGSNESTH